MEFILNKNEIDGFSSFTPRAMFKKMFNSEPKLKIDSEFAYYNNKLFIQIENYLNTFEKFKQKSMINKNRNIVDEEIIYVSQAKGVIFSIKQHWNICEYAIGEFEEEDEDEFSNVVIKKNSRFQARISILSIEDNIELEKFFLKIISKDKKEKRRERELNIICYRPNDGIYLKSFPTSKVNIDINDNYNDDFLDVSKEIIKRLSKKDDNGIVLLHSEPGCGKTSYLRFICQNIKNKRIIYLPPDLTHRLAEPDFMSFLMETPNSILIIEDGENALQKRDAGGNQAVSNLLNNSDGLLGDALKLQVICTFNCDISNIDEGLLRPGRLIAEYKFEKLKKDKVKNLFSKLYKEDSEIYKNYKGEELTLAEIYNMDKKKFLSKKNTVKIGFNNGKN